MHWEGKLKLRSYNANYCLIEIEMVTKAGLTVTAKYSMEIIFWGFFCWKFVRNCSVLFILFICIVM